VATYNDRLGPTLWSVSDGRAGNVAQASALIQALSQTRRWIQLAHIAGTGDRDGPLNLSPRAPWTWLPASMWRLSRWSVPAVQRRSLQPPWPSLWIAAGRRSAPFTRDVRRWSAGETFTVQILDPKMDPSLFDLVVVPDHDGLRGENVIRTLGSPSFFSEEAIEEAGQTFVELSDEPKQSAIVILGGHSKIHRFTQTDQDHLMAQLDQLTKGGWRLRITTSRRTPLDVVAQMRAFADRTGAKFWSGPHDGPNPYLGWLLYSSVAIVTEDSANMLSDAAWHGLPIHMARLSGSSRKFDHFHESLIARGCARWFEGSLSHWDYTPLREAERVADRITAELLTRYPQPDLPQAQDKTAPPDWMLD